MSSALGSKAELLNVLSNVKARVQDKLGIVDFPLPQFIVLGRQSVGKSRLVETLAGETFNFISGTLGSRRPTVLEFRNVKTDNSRWFVRRPGATVYEEHPVNEVMKIVGAAHEACGDGVQTDSIGVRVESPRCVDMSIVDLPGFRDFAADAAKQHLAEAIVDMNMKFMRDPRNVMLCVEQAGDAANMSTLDKCRDLDPSFDRTILVRNKLDKYYGDLHADNVKPWVEGGMGDIPENLMSFVLTLPWWPDGTAAPKPFDEIRSDKNNEDVNMLKSKGLSDASMVRVGYKNFEAFMERKVEQLFSDAIGPVLTKLKALKDETDSRKVALATEFEDTDPTQLVGTIQDAGVAFAQALGHEMEGVLKLTVNRQTLETELRDFHAKHQALGSTHFDYLPTEDFSGLIDYIDYLRNEIQVGAFEVEINGGAQFRRLMQEVEIFLRFSEIAAELKKRDVIQARGVGMSSLTWRDVVVKLLSNEAHLPLKKRVWYVGERITGFFENQKEATLEFMDTLEGTPLAKVYSPLYPRYAKLIKTNPMVKQLIFNKFDAACKRQLSQFIDLFENMLTSTFSNPWVFLKGATDQDDEMELDCLPAFPQTKARLVKEITARSGIEDTISGWLSEIPTDPTMIDDAVDKVQMLVIKTYSFIRSQVCDQVELFAESFFKLPMMRRLEEDMHAIELSDEEKATYKARRDKLQGEVSTCSTSLTEIEACINELTDFKLKTKANQKTAKRGNAVFTGSFT